MQRRTLLTMMAAAVWSHAAVAPSLSAQAPPAAANAYAIPPEFATGGPYAPNDVRIVVSVKDRRLWVIAQGDTVRSATVSVASGRELAYAGRRWKFATPRGQLRVRGKRTAPVWLPPDWHYAEVASTFGLQLQQLPAKGRRLRNGALLTVRNSIVGLVMPNDSTFLDLPVGEHIVFDSTLFIPPVSSRNRRLSGELGHYALDLGNGYLLHGTFDQRSIGSDTTHGCIRLLDDDLEWLYHNVPVGATVLVR